MTRIWYAVVDVSGQRYAVDGEGWVAEHPEDAAALRRLVAATTDDKLRDEVARHQRQLEILADMEREDALRMFLNRIKDFAAHTWWALFNLGDAIELDQEALGKLASGISDSLVAFGSGAGRTVGETMAGLIRGVGGPVGSAIKAVIPWWVWALGAAGIGVIGLSAIARIVGRGGGGTGAGARERAREAAARAAGAVQRKAAAVQRRIEGRSRGAIPG
jgi:hypothetical protein